jgi:hypothetical protein
MTPVRSVALVTLVNDQAQFEQCRQSLLSNEPEPIPWRAVDADRHGWNAATALNGAIETIEESWVACVHQDVLFPRRWLRAVSTALRGLAQDVSVVGLVGTRRDGRFRGHIVDPNGHCFWGPLPADVLTLDEHVLLLRRSSGLRFDPKTPGFHCYAADISLEAHARGGRVVVIDAPVTHTSTGIADAKYEEATRWLLEKWGSRYDWILPTPPRLLFDTSRSALLDRWIHRWRRRRDSLRRNPRGLSPWNHAF